MSTLDEIKAQINELTPEEQIEIWNYATSKGTVAKQWAEEVKVLSLLPIPITENDRNFIERNKYNKDTQWDKIIFTKDTIEIGGLKFPRTIVKYDDIKNTPWLELNNNVYQKDDYSCFTFDAVEQLGKAWYKIPNRDQRKQVVDICWWYRALAMLLNYSEAPCMSNGTRYFGPGLNLWSSTTSQDNINAYSVLLFTSTNGMGRFVDKNEAISLVFLQN